MRQAIHNIVATLRAAEWIPVTAARVMIVWLIFSGPGRYSIDGLIE